MNFAADIDVEYVAKCATRAQNEQGPSKAGKIDPQHYRLPLHAPVHGRQPLGRGQSRVIPAHSHKCPSMLLKADMFSFGHDLV